jgi:HSP90 family molecular chaperone
MRLHQVTIDRESLSEEVIYKYGDAHAGFRELIQNAKDAILDYYDLYPASNSGTIIVNIFPTLVEVTDNGIGMNIGGVDAFLLRMYGTSKDRTLRNRAGVFGRGFFAIFKEAAEVIIFTRKEDDTPMYLRVYPKDNWFIAEELTLTELPPKTVPYVRKFGTHGTTVLCIPRTGFVTDTIFNYLTQVCQFFDIPIILNGQKINRSFEDVLKQRETRAIVTFDKLGVQGALGYKANDNMIQTFVQNIKILNLISPEGGVNGFINYNKLEVTPSRDALVQNENYKIFINVLTEMCNAVLQKLSEDPTSDDYQRLLDFAYSTDNVTILKNLKIFKLVGQEDKISLQDLIARAEKKRLVFVAEERTVVADRLKKRGYVVVHELSPRLKELLTNAIRNSGMHLSSVDTPLGRKLAGTLEPRRIIPETQQTSSERKLVEIVKSMVPEGMKIEIMEGDPFDDAEHVPGVIRLQRNGELMRLALDLEIIVYPFMVKVIMVPLISHEITHEQIGTIHDETFYEVYEGILKTMHRKLVDEFKELVKSEKI